MGHAVLVRHYGRLLEVKYQEDWKDMQLEKLLTIRWKVFENWEHGIQAKIGCSLQYINVSCLFCGTILGIHIKFPYKDI